MDAKAVTEIEDGVIIVQGQRFQEGLQFGVSGPNFRWVGLVGFGIGLVDLIQDSGTVTVTGIKGMFVNILFQGFG